MKAADEARQQATYNINNTGVQTAAERHETDNESQQVQGRGGPVVASIPGTFLDENPPHDGREVEGEAGNEQSRRDTQQVGEERNRLGNDESNDGDGSDESQPRSPTGEGVDVLDDGVFEDAAVDEASDDDGVDGTGDEDDGKTDTESNLGDSVTSGQEGRRLDIRTDKGVHDASGEGVDKDLNQTQRPDGLLVVGGGVHLVHEGELADGETVGEDDVGDGEERFIELDVLLGPSRPLHRIEATLLLAGLNTSGNDGDTDGQNDGNEIDVTENGDFGERRRNGKEKQDNGRNDTEDDGAGGVLGDVVPGNGTGKTVRADKQDQLKCKHATDEFVTKASPELATNLLADQATSIGVMRSVREHDLDLSDNITGVNSEETKTNGADGTGDHTESGKSRGQTQRTEGDSLDNENNSETLPAETVEVSLTLGSLLLFEIGARQVGDLTLDGVAKHAIMLLGGSLGLGSLLGDVGRVGSGFPDRVFLVHDEDG